MVTPIFCKQLHCKLVYKYTQQKHSGKITDHYNFLKRKKSDKKFASNEVVLLRMLRNFTFSFLGIRKLAIVKAMKVQRVHILEAYRYYKFFLKFHNLHLIFHSNISFIINISRTISRILDYLEFPGSVGILHQIKHFLCTI